MTEFAVIGLSAAILLVLWKSRWNYNALPELRPAQTRERPDVTVVIPARNEAHQIERAVKSFRGLPVIVVDDHSTDNTASVAMGGGARVISAPPLHEGAKGKPNGCLAGATHVHSRWILFVDADTWYEECFAASIVDYAVQQNLQVVTAFLEQRCESFFEHMLLPYAFALYFCGVSAANVNNAASGEALANGQCLLFDRVAYESIGGHASVMDSVIEDVALAAEAKQKGLRLRVVRAEKLGHVRMYDGFGAIWSGFQKNSFRFLTVNPGSGVQVILASILLTSWLPVLIWAIRDTAGLRQALFTPAVVLLIAPVVGLWPWYRGWRVLLGFSAIYLFQLIALNAMLSTIAGRKAIWKDRRV